MLITVLLSEPAQIGDTNARHHRYQESCSSYTLIPLFIARSTSFTAGNLTAGDEFPMNFLSKSAKLALFTEVPGSMEFSEVR
jgi:hypothetical protein